MLSDSTARHLAHMQINLQTTLPDARIEVAPLPQLPDIQLGLINDDYQTGPLAAEVMHAVIAQPAYWAFCWGSGLAMARWLLDQPGVVRGRQVVDLGAGSGIVGIAASKAGAATVWACDNDPQALDASRANASLNQVNLQFATDLNALPAKVDLICMADVLYDRSNFALIELAKARCRELIIADSRISDVEDSSFELTHTAQALTCPNLGEFEEFRCVRFFRWRA